MDSKAIEYMAVALVAPALRAGLANMYLNEAFRFGSYTQHVASFDPYNTVNS